MGKQEVGPGTTHKLELQPCHPEYKQSLKCLDRNGYDRNACRAEFDAYKDCKQKEIDLRYQRRLERQGRA